MSFILSFVWSFAGGHNCVRFLAPKKMTMDHSGSPCLKPGMERVWANYIAKWIEAYQAGTEGLFRCT